MMLSNKTSHRAINAKTINAEDAMSIPTSLTKVAKPELEFELAA
jgi:hypothetical protein